MKKSELSAACICDIENGKEFPSALSLQKIASAFYMDIVELLIYTENSFTIALEHLGSEENKELLEWIMSGLKM